MVHKIKRREAEKRELLTEWEQKSPAFKGLIIWSLMEGVNFNTAVHYARHDYYKATDERGGSYDPKFVNYSDEDRKILKELGVKREKIPKKAITQIEKLP